MTLCHSERRGACSPHQHISAKPALSPAEGKSRRRERGSPLRPPRFFASGYNSHDRHEGWHRCRTNMDGRWLRMTFNKSTSTRPVILSGPPVILSAEAPARRINASPRRNLGWGERSGAARIRLSTDSERTNGCAPPVILSAEAPARRPSASSRRNLGVASAAQHSSRRDSSLRDATRGPVRGMARLANESAGQLAQNDRVRSACP